MKKERLKIDNLKKNEMLKYINLTVNEGECVHCIFDNAHEKNQFLRILSGKDNADYGKVYYNENEIKEKEVSKLLEEKVAIISKECRLIKSVSIIENIFIICHQFRKQWVISNKLKKRAVNLFDEFEIQLDLNKDTDSLTNLEMVEIEILKAYMLGKEIITLDSLANWFGNNEKDKLKKLIIKLKKKGISFILMEPLEDIDFLYTDMIYIIKHGKTSAIKEIKECDYMMLHAILYQDEMEKRINEKIVFSKLSNSKESFKIQGLTSSYFKQMSFQVHKGEIVKLFCMDEKSYEEITGIFRGKVPVVEGEAFYRNNKVRLSGNIKGLQNKIGIIEGIDVQANFFMDLSVMDNLQILLSHKINGIWLKQKYRKSISIQLKNILSEDLYKKQVKELNNLELQKVLYCKWLLYSPELLVCIHPFAEGDIKAREAARQMIYILKNRGISILIITSNSEEMNYCNGREIYLKKGYILSKEDAYRKIK